MKKYYILIMALCFTWSAKAQTSYKTLVDSLANNYLQNHAGSLVIGLYDNGKESLYYYGETTQGNKQKPDSNSIFELGGLSETFTSALYAEMSIKGIVKPDEKLQDFLPVDVPAPVYEKIICVKAVETTYKDEDGDPQQLRLNFTPYVCFPDPSTKPQYIILCDLSTHTTSLPEYPNNLCKKKNRCDAVARYSKEDLYDFLRKYSFNEPLGYDYKHSETGIALLGHALALKSHEEFDTLITERLFSPLQMTSTGVKITSQQQRYLVSGYNTKGKLKTHWTYDVMAPALGIYSSPGDMMKFLSANVSKEKNPYTDILDYTHNARLKLTDKKRKDTEIALAWKINSIGDEGQRVIWQEGSTEGFSSYIGFVETNHTGVFILSSVSKNVNTIGTELLKKLTHEKL